MPTETLAIPDSTPCETLPRYRYRLRFSKTGDLRLVSHHDLMHVFERMMRRGEIPFAVSKGFHPQPKMSFALSLALGVVGRNEVFDIELTRDLTPDELILRFNRQAPEGLAFLSIVRCEKKPSSQVRRTFYRVDFSDGERGVLAPRGTESLRENIASEMGTTPSEGLRPPLADSISNFLSQSEHWVVRTRPERRRINVRPFVCELAADSSALSMILWVTPTGAARPEEIVFALGLGSLLDGGAILERTHLELLDEVPEHERFVPDLAAAAVFAPATDTPNDGPPSEEPARRPMPTAILDNPLSFDS